MTRHVTVERSLNSCFGLTARSSVQAPHDAQDLEPFAIMAPEPSPFAGFICICPAERTVVPGGLVYIERLDGLVALRYCEGRTAGQVSTSFWVGLATELRLMTEEIPAADIAEIAPVLWIKTRL